MAARRTAARRGERFGVAGLSRPAGPLVWVHAASVGETTRGGAADRPADRRLARRCSSPPARSPRRRSPSRRLPAGAIHQFVPIDTPASVGRFLDHWRPGLALFAESELWPTMLRALRRRALPLAVVNARMSERSFRSWRAVAPLARAVVGNADLFLAQTPADAERLARARREPRRRLRQPEVRRAAAAGRRSRGRGAARRRSAGGRCSSRRARIRARRRPSSPRMPGSRPAADALLTILAPRHPERGDAVAAASRRRRPFVQPPLARASRSSRTTDIYLADTIGEMGLWYRLADVAFLGGSMVPHGGQNPIEPAKLLVPILHGGHVEQFPRRLRGAGCRGRGDRASTTPPRSPRRSNA